MSGSTRHSTRGWRSRRRPALSAHLISIKQRKLSRFRHLAKCRLSTRVYLETFAQLTAILRLALGATFLYIATGLGLSYLVAQARCGLLAWLLPAWHSILYAATFVYALLGIYKIYYMNTVLIGFTLSISTI